MNQNRTSKAVNDFLERFVISGTPSGIMVPTAVLTKYKKTEEALERIGQPIESRPIDSKVDAGTFYISQATDKVRIAQEVLAFDPLK